jgi:signal transduction histidine kinase
LTLTALSLRGKLFVFAALLILVPGVLLGFLADRSARESLQTVIGRELARESLHSAERLSALLTAERDILASFARQGLMREIRVGDIDKRISRSLTTLRDGSPARAAYVVLDADGRVVAATDPAWFGGPASREIAALVVSRPFSGPRLLEGRPLLALTAEVPDPDGGDRQLGQLVGLLEWSYLEGMLDAVRQDLAAQQVTATVVLVDAGGAVIARAGDAEAAAAAPEGGRGWVIDHERDSIAGTAALSGAGLPEWRLWIVEPLENALAPARSLTRRLAMTTALALAGALLLATLSARRVVRPLSELTVAIRGMATGRLGGTPVPVRSEDEVGMLARSFNRMASELDEAQKHLVEAEKFAFVGELASGVAHEVRTSLGVLRSSAQMLERSLPNASGSETSELVGMIRDEVGRLGGVVDDLLTLDRPRALHLEPTPVSQPLARAVEFVEPKAREKGVLLALERFDRDREPRVSCDREALQHVCVNLLVNAIQATPAGGHVKVRILEPRGDDVRIWIEDDGPGIPDDLRERIFEPFVTARAAGVGLGLTFVKRAIHEHEGRIRVGESESGGARFEIELPLAADEAAATGDAAP